MWSTKINVSKGEARWTDFMADFIFTTFHRPGKKNLADTFSRSIANVEFVLRQEEKEQLQELLASGYATDPFFKVVIRGLKNKEEQLQGRHHWDTSTGRLYLKEPPVWRLWIPVGRLHFCHDSVSAGHPGRDRTHTGIIRNYYWPRMGRFVVRYVKAIRACQRAKGSKPRKNRLQSLPVPSRPWKLLGNGMCLQEETWET